MFGSPRTHKERSASAHRPLRRFRILVSESYDPFQNLSLEESLFEQFQLKPQIAPSDRYTPQLSSLPRTAPQSPLVPHTAPQFPQPSQNEEILLLYINTPAVVVGKHQNAWKECNVSDLLHRRIPLLRRISGGGAVYHDRGNILWSFISAQEGFSQEANLSIIRRVLAQYSGIAGEQFALSPQGDILCTGYKVSGNALCFRKGKVLHHGTVLVNSNLADLGNLLKGLQHFYSIEFRGVSVDSRPQPVACLRTLALERDISEDTPKTGTNENRQVGRALGIQSFLKSFERAISHADVQATASVQFISNAQAQRIITPKIRSRHNSIEWRYRRSPNCIITPKIGTNTTPLNPPSIAIQSGYAHLPQNQRIDITNLEGLGHLHAYLKHFS